MHYTNLFDVWLHWEISYSYISQDEYDILIITES